MPPTDRIVPSIPVETLLRSLFEQTSKPGSTFTRFPSPTGVFFLVFLFFVPDHLLLLLTRHSRLNNLSRIHTRNRYHSIRDQVSLEPTTTVLPLLPSFTYIQLLRQLLIHSNPFRKPKQVLTFCPSGIKQIYPLR